MSFGKRFSERRFLLFRLPWLALAALLVTAGVAGAFWEPPRPDPFQPVRPLSLDWLIHPSETNAFLRLPAISASLRDVFFLPDGKRGWAVGSSGTILHTPDGGRTWRQQTPPFTEPRQQRQVQEQQQQQQQQQQQYQPQQQQQQSLEVAPPPKGPQKEDLPPQEPPSEVAAPALPDLAAVQFMDDGRQGWAVGSGGTVLATRDGGATWTPQASGTRASLSAVHFAGPETGWAVGEGGTILATRDGGATWTPQPSGTLRIPLRSVHFAGPEAGWVVGPNATMLATHDGGATWTPQASGTQASLSAVHFAGPEAGWGVGHNGAILATRDGGATWTPQASGTQASLSAVHFAGPETGWAVGEGGTILATRDGGATWTPQASGTQASLSAVHFAGPETGWAVGEGGTILATRDGGATWTPQASGTRQRLYDVHFENPETGWAVGEGGTILATRDGGATWTPQASGTRQRLYDVHFENPETGWAVGGGGTILATGDGGATWAPQTSGTGQDLTGVHFAGPEAGWTVGRGGAILATPDRGATWTLQISVEHGDESLSAVHFVSPQTGWAVGYDGAILVTRDGGAKWTPQQSRTEEILTGVHFADFQTGWAVGSVGILATGDGGATWTLQISGGADPPRAVHFADNQTGWAVGLGGRILATRDGGTAWTSQESGTDQGLMGVHFAGPETGWAVGDGGTILSTRDGGKNWQPLENYRRDPAPWVYLAWLGAFGCLIAAARKLPADLEQAPQSVADRLASDRPLELGDPDPLGYQRIAAGLSRFLRNEKTEPPLTVAITGEWGSGKSSLMNLVRADLERYEFRPVWFNAWHHQKEEHLFAALLEAVRGQAVPGWWSYAGLVFRWRLLRQRTRAHLLWTVLFLTVLGVLLGLTVAKWPQITTHLSEWGRDFPIANMRGSGDAAALPEGAQGEFGQWFGGLLAPLTPLITLLTALLGAWAALRNRMASWELSPAKLMASLGEKSRIRALDAQLGFRHQFAAAFREVCEALHPRTLTIVIDDLDRCRPEQVVETLEAVNFLVTAGPCYVILGIAPEQVMRCVGLGFKDIAAEMAAANVHTADEGRAWRREFAKNYLEKLINVEVPVPTLTSEDARKIVAAAGEDEQPRRLERHRASSWMAACFAVLFVSALYVGANVHEWLQPSNVTDASDPAAADTRTDVTPTPAVPETPVTREATAQPPQEADGAFFREGKHADAPWWSWQIPLAALGVLGGLVLLLHVLRREDPVVRDSKDFSDALDIWVPVLLTRTRSPRAVKRFVNRVRYYAMCEARPEPTPTWKVRLLELLGRTPQSSLTTPTTRLPETLLVALGAIREWRPEMLATADALDVQMTLGDHPPGWPDETVSSAVQRHAEAFGGFSPQASEIERFRAVAAGVTVR